MATLAPTSPAAVAAHLPSAAEVIENARALGIIIQRSTPTIGAEISGVDLDRPLTEAQAQVIRDAWLRFKAIFFRDADISHESHVRLGYIFGIELEGHPVLPHVEGHPLILRIRGVEGVNPTPEKLPGFMAHNKWHTDVTFRPRPSIASLLRMRLMPPLGGDTMWSDMAAAYTGLPEGVKERLEGLYAEHDIVRSFGSRVSDERREQLRRDLPPSRHPVVRVHPETGEKILYVNYTFTTHICDIEPDESEKLLRLLFDRVKVPEYHVRFRWTPNALGIWDNRSTQHYAVGDYWPHDRELERVTVAGDVVE